MEGRADGIWWRSSGKGDQPLVLIQGLGYPAAMFHRLIPLLEPHFRVIVFDHRGIGNSADAGGLDGQTIGSMAGDVSQVIEEAVGAPADVFGVSLGGIVAQELALAYPRQVRRLILACTHTADARVVLAEAEVLEMMQKRWTLDDEQALRSSVPYVYAPNASKKLIEGDLAVRRAAHVGWDGYKAQMNAAMRFGGTSDRLPRVRSATLVLHGELDRLVPPGNAEVISSRIPGAELKTFRGLSHNFYSEDPKATAAEIISFLTRPGLEELRKSA